VANTKSAVKRARTSEERRLRNRQVKSRVRTAVRRFNDALTAGNLEKAQAALQHAISTIDRATSKGVIHRNTAARKKSRLVAMLHKTEA